MHVTQSVEIDLNITQVVEAIRHATPEEREIVMRSLNTPAINHLNRTVGDEWTESLLGRLRGLGVVKLDQLVKDLETKGVL